MKKSLLNINFFLLVFSSLFSGCGDTDEIKRNQEDLKNRASIFNSGVPLYKICVIDSCEYIVTQYFNSRAAVTHKGNCKYCRQRSK